MNNYDELNRRAIRYYKAHEIKSTAIAVSGSEVSLVLLNAAVQAMGNENVLAIVADTGHISEKTLDIIEAACDMLNIERCILPVFLNDITVNENSPDYKQQIFEEMLQECWLLGFDSLSCACTAENMRKNGNEIISTFDGVTEPLFRPLTESHTFHE